MFIAAAALVLMTGCKNPQEDETVVRQRDSLMSVIDEREASVNDFINSFNEIEHDLDVVTSKQHIILKNSDKEIKANQKDRINEEIKIINELMESNSNKIKELNKKLGSSAGKNAKLQKTIEILNNQLNQKYAELAELNERLNTLSAQVTILQIYVDTLATQNMAQMQTINSKTEELHKAYYVVGTAKDLEKSNLIDKKGGLLGIGRTAKLADNIDNSMFTQIDYTQTTTIPVNSKNMKMITTHPSDSYTLDKTDKMVNSITITNPDKFWSASKYLVVTK
jgi:DNA repair exonuclease SbcCD ATPase subunit